MKYIRWVGMHPNGEPKAWWSWQNLSQSYREECQRKGKGVDQSNAWPKHGRVWLHWYNNQEQHNAIGVEWDLFSRSFGLSLHVSDQALSDQAIIFGVRIPFLLSLWFSLERAKWVRRLPGIRYVPGGYSRGERELSIHYSDGSIWWNLWVDPFAIARDWRDHSFHLDCFFFGWPTYSESQRIATNTYLNMPEGKYPCVVELYTARWKRPRWPWPKTIQRANVIVEGGVPIPGKGDNDWDMGDDFLYDSTFPAKTVIQALAEVEQSVARTRIKYASEGWTPDAGWPAHCIQKDKNHGRIK